MKTKKNNNVTDLKFERSLIFDLTTYYVHASFHDAEDELQFILVDICDSLTDAKESASAYKQENPSAYVYIKAEKKVVANYHIL